MKAAETGQVVLRRLTGRMLEAAQLVAEDKLSNEAISEKVGISLAQLKRWRRHPEFAAKVEEHCREFAETVRSRGIARLSRRINSYLQDFEALNQIIEERGADLQDIPGGATGFIVRDYKGKNADQPFYCYDSALMRDRLALRKQLAQELGQWTERVRTDGVKVNVDVDARREGLKNLTLAELLELERLTAKAMVPAARPQPPEEVLALPQPTKAEDDVPNEDQH